MGEVVDHVRAGKGPAAVEFDTERFFGHFEGDPQNYRGEGEIARLREERDSIKIFREHAAKNKLVSKKDLDAIDKEVSDLIDKSVEESRAAAPPTADDVLTDVYIDYI